MFFGLVKMTFGLVDVGYSLQAVKLIFFAPWLMFIELLFYYYYYFFFLGGGGGGGSFQL